MVSAMTSYSSLTSRRIFVSRQHSTESDFEFHQCPKYSRTAVFSSFAKQCLLSVNLKLFLMQTEQQTQQRQIVNTRRGRFHTEKSPGARTPTWNSYSTAQATKMETAPTNSGEEGTSLNECRLLKYFTSKWKRFWIISLNISANIAVTKHTLLADEFIPYRPRLLGFHSLRVNVMKCIYVGVSLSKLQSFFWKISLNSRLIRLEGFNNKILTNFPVCPSWPSGKALALCVEGLNLPGKTFFS